MSSTDVSTEGATGAAPVRAGELKLEVVVLPVADVDRAKHFYEGLGWRLDADFPISETFRVVQLTPPGSACSIQFGVGLTSADPGSAQATYLIVSDIEKARAQLIDLGADVGEIFHRVDGEEVSGPAPERATYGSFARFSDPDGNSWMLQEITERLPGR
jgi:catechol 2,3-dioxygenase-like lactoylglutathione lyase family enzyme